MLRIPFFHLFFFFFFIFYFIFISLILGILVFLYFLFCFVLFNVFVECFKFTKSGCTYLKPSFSRGIKNMTFIKKIDNHGVKLIFID